MFITTMKNTGWVMAYPKLKTTKRDVPIKELAERFGCSTRTVARAWSQSHATWYRRGKPMPPETVQQEKK